MPNGVRHEPPRSSWACALSVTRAGARFPPTMPQVCRSSNTTCRPCSLRRSTGPTDSSGTKSTAGDRSSRVGCTPPASPAATATSPTARSCARPATRSAPSATRRRSTTSRRITFTVPAVGAPNAPAATCRRLATCSSTRATTTACGCRDPTSRSRSACPMLARAVTPIASRSGRRRRCRPGTDMMRPAISDSPRRSTPRRPARAPPPASWPRSHAIHSSRPSCERRRWRNSLASSRGRPQGWTR